MEDIVSTLSPDAAVDYTLLNFSNSLVDVSNSPAEFANATTVLGAVAGADRGGGGGRVFSYAIKAVYVLGIVGNAAAIVAIRRGERRVRNRKHLLLLTVLAANDLVALMGMLCAMVVAEAVPAARVSRAYCAARVVLRVFGVGSVCIAVTMALERYLALTKPFLYQKQVTYYVIRTALLVSWLWAAALTCVPMVGLGAYYDQRAGVCIRYRNAETTVDFAYAVFYVTFGILLCVVLVYCNLAVIRALYAISAPRAGQPPPVRRVSKSSCRHKQRPLNGNGVAAVSQPQHIVATVEEVFFSRLMATLSVLFMICWMPQMITSVLYLSLGKEAWPRLGTLAAFSDLLMLLNYVLDPVLYVLMRRNRLTQLCHSMAPCFKWQSDKSSTESMKTSCCPQETLLVSESSQGQGAAAELRSLKPVVDPPAPLHSPRPSAFD